QVFGSKSSKTAAADLAAAVAANESFAAANQSPSLPVIQTWNRVPPSGNDQVRRVQMTMDAIRAIARHLAGYPGRKRLIWVSSSFPFSITPQPGSTRFDDPWSYRGQAATVMNALANARVSLYPARPWLISIQQDSTNAPRKDGQPAFAATPVQASTDYATVPMQEFVGQTGGQACIDDNDLAYLLRHGGPLHGPRATSRDHERLALRRAQRSASRPAALGARTRPDHPCGT